MRVAKSIFQVAVLVLAVTMVGCSTFETKSIVLPPHRNVTLKNGLQVLKVQDHSLPYVSIGLLVRSGSTNDPISKSGLANLTATLLNQGAGKYTALELANQFALLGTNFSSETGHDFMYFSSSALAKDQDRLLHLFFETVTQPRFDEKDFNLQRYETMAQIRRNYDQPAWVASRIFAQYLYGAHPYARANIGTLHDVSSIRRQDVVRFYKANFVPNNCDLVLVGDWHAGLTKNLNKMLAGWHPKKVTVRSMPPLMPIKGQQILFVRRSGLKQTEIRIGHYGIRRNNPDYQALMVADVILSGGFNSRLTRAIRVKAGLTYGIYASFDALKNVGPFVIETNTRNPKAGEVVADTLQVLKTFRDKGVTSHEVADAKSYLRGSFPMETQTPDELASELLALKFYGIGDSYLTDYVQNLNKLSTSDINRVIKKYFHPNNIRIVVYGPPSDLAELRPLGAVEVKPFSELAVGL